MYLLLQIGYYQLTDHYYITLLLIEQNIEYKCSEIMRIISIYSIRFP